MNKLIFFLIYLILLVHVRLIKIQNFGLKHKIFLKKNYRNIYRRGGFRKEFNANVSINLGKRIDNALKVRNYFNNDGQLNYNGLLKKSSRFKFSRIKNFYKFEPIISFDQKNLVFFDDKGSILKFDEKSKLIWKKNYYSKSEKKLKPILQFSNNEKF